jgi:hypothetical protein
MNLALHSENTHSNVHVVCVVLQNTEDFGWCMHSMSISCLVIVYSMVHFYYCPRWGHIEIWHGVMHRTKCMWNINAQYKKKNGAQWILSRNAKVVPGSYWRDGEGRNRGYRCVEERFTFCCGCAR